IPNVYNSDMTASAAGRGRLAIVGEPIVAVDLINTVAAPGSAVTNDLLSAERGTATWWWIERARVPGEGLPDIQALRRLRSALGVAGHAGGAGRRRPRPAGGRVRPQLLPAFGACQHAIAADRDGAARGDALARGVRRESAAGVHRQPGRSVPVRPVEGQQAAA